MAIDPKHLANLLAVAQHGSFNRAATARGISQPALSNSIAQLERKLGVKVLDRTRRGSELNEFGKLLVHGAQTIEAVLLQTHEQLRLKKLGIEGPLRIGATPSLTLKFLPDLMTELLKQTPPVEITLTEGLDDQLLPALQAGELDLMLGPISGVFSAPNDVVEDALFDDPFGIGIGPQNALSKRKSLTLAELQNQPWVLPPPGSAYRRHVESLFVAEGVNWPANTVITSSLSLVEAIVTQSNRITLITELQAALHNTWRIRAIPLRSGGKRTVGIRWRRAGQLSALAKRAVQIAHDLAHSYQSASKGPIAHKHRLRLKRRDQ